MLCLMLELSSFVYDLNLDDFLNVLNVHFFASSTFFPLNIVRRKTEIETKTQK